MDDYNEADPRPHVAVVVRAIASMGPAVLSAALLFTGLWMVVGSLVAAPMSDDRCLDGNGEHCEATVIGFVAFGASALALAVYAILVIVPVRTSPAKAALPIALPVALWVAAWITFALRVEMPGVMWFLAAGPALALIAVELVALCEPWAREQPRPRRRKVAIPPPGDDESIWPWQRGRDGPPGPRHP